MGRPGFAPPMLARLVTEAPPGPGWVYERKLDGLRCIAVRHGDRAELWSRSRQSFTRRFAGIADAVADLPAADLVLDGEIVALDGDRTSFSLLQRPGSTATPILCVFDILRRDGEDLTARPLRERREILAAVVGERGIVRRVGHLEGDPQVLLRRAWRAGWEGLIAKRADGPYRSGRSGDWLKLKCSASRELVIGGWTEPRGSRTHFGALLVGYHDPDGALRHAGKVGTGFDHRTLAEVHRRLVALGRAASPFAERVRERTAHWVEPELVANVAFTEWTDDGKLRHPRFEGLRDDKPAASVVRERREARAAFPVRRRPGCHHGPVDASIPRRSFLAAGAAGAVGLLAGGAVSGAGALRAEARGTGNDGPGPVPDAPPGDERVEGRHSDGRRRDVAFYTAAPAGHGDGSGLPVCLVLHGASATAADFPRFGFGRFLTDAVRRGAAPFVLAGATGSARGWEAAAGDDPMRMVAEELPRWCAERRFDTTRLVAWGWSLGGAGVLRLAEVHPGFVRAVAAFSPAVSPGDRVFADAGGLRGTGVGLWCGRDDGLYPRVRRLEQALPEPPRTGSYGPGHHTRAYWNRITPAAFDFLAATLSP